MKTALLIFILSFVLTSNKTFAEEVAIYSDDGTWAEGIIALEHFLDYYNISNKRIYAVEFASVDNLKAYSAICFPGGYAYNYSTALKAKGINNLRTYVSEGGSYIGICAGAYFASKTVDWEGESYPYSLSLFDGTAFGAIDDIIEWDNYTMTDISLNPNSSISENLESNYKVMYFGGPIFYGNPGFAFDTVATWDLVENLPAIIRFNHNSGKVLLIAPHLEIEESSSRDGSSFGSELNDVESDWDFLLKLFRWSVPVIASVEESDVSRLNISPNPASDYIDIAIENRNEAQNSEIKVFDLLGECIAEYHFPIGSASTRIDISNFQNGVYLIYTRIDNIDNFSKLFVVE